VVFPGRGGSAFRVVLLPMAVQLCTLPWLGFVPDYPRAAPAAAVGRLSQRLGVPMGELRGYGEREQTRTDHLREVIACAGWRTMDATGWKDLDEFLFARAMEHDGPKLLFRLACEYLVSSRAVRPGVVHTRGRLNKPAGSLRPTEPAYAAHSPRRLPGLSPQEARQPA
jgi:hypothetical protein